MNKQEKEHKAYLRAQKALATKAKNILKYMLKTDVLFYHHGRTDSMKDTVEKALTKVVNGIKDKTYTHSEYHPYIWNYQGQGRNYIPLVQLNCLWKGPFDTIYDVPLDGSYIFSVFDSGQRGSGSFHGITATKVTEQVEVSKVSPGSMIPITAF